MRLLKPGKRYLATVSGVASTNFSMIEYFDQEVEAIDIITTKSYQVVPNPGNPEPIICEMETGSFGNSVGLRNPGMEKGLEDVKRLKKAGMRALLNVSLSASNPEDFITLVKAFAPWADLLELNFSCPHAAQGFGASIGCSAVIASEYVKKIKEATEGITTPVFVKLTPNVENIGLIAKAVVDAGADGLVAINTVGPEVHIDKTTGTPILNNPLGGKGGKSGRWVWPAALNAVKAVRKAVGPSVPIIGMGGVDSGEKARQLYEAGANAVGIGSAFSLVNQKQWPVWLEAVRREAAGAQIDSSSLLRRTRMMDYVSYTVERVEHHGDDITLLHLDGELESEAGEFCFIRLPGKGEKPFSVATTSPLSFVIKKRGSFTAELCALKAGDTLQVRGLYGSPVETLDMRRSIIIAGGTGVAVVPMLARKLKDEGSEISILAGTSVSDSGEPLLLDELKEYGSYLSVADDGKPGRVLDELDKIESFRDTGFYFIGPEIFMRKGAERLVALGVPSSSIMMSMEKMTRCGVGLCGECACGHRLMCQWGSFFTYDYLKENEISFL